MDIILQVRTCVASGHANYVTKIVLDNNLYHRRKMTLFGPYFYFQCCDEMLFNRQRATNELYPKVSPSSSSSPAAAAAVPVAATEKDWTAGSEL